jgi:hypothetical protein
VRELDDAFDVGHRPRPVRDVGDRDEHRVLIDRGVEVLQGHGSIRPDWDVHDAGAPRFLRMPDLPDGREVEVGEDDLRPARVPQTARQGGDARRE